MKTIVTVPSTLEIALGVAAVKSETRISRAELKRMFTVGSRWALVASLMGDNGNAPRPRTVLRQTSYGFEFDAGGGRASSLLGASWNHLAGSPARVQAELSIQRAGIDRNEVISMSIAIKLTKREYDTVLAALRMWQAEVTDNMTETEGIPLDYAGIALEHGDALTSESIDKLINRMQTTQAGA